MTAYGFFVDHASCWGCKTCEVACKQENSVPGGVKLISVAEKGPMLTDEGPYFQFHVNVCRHCDEPECVEACPEEAISKREDGIVILDEEACSGCGLCVEACPYDVIAFDETRGIATKCNLCHHRVDRGLIPACADNVCLAHCIHFGESEALVVGSTG